MAPKRASTKKKAEHATEPGGDSEDWARSQSNQKRLANLMLAWLPDAQLKAQAGDDWDKAPASVVASVEIYQWHATFLCSVYTFEKAKVKHHLHFSSVMAAWGGLIAQTQTRLSKESGLAQGLKVPPEPLKPSPPAPPGLISQTFC